MKSFARSMIVAVLLLSYTAAAGAAPVLHRCAISIECATPNELVLELWSTSRSTSYSVDVNYSHGECRPWRVDGAQSWVVREELPPGIYALSWPEFYDRNPGPGMEACINYTCQPEVVVIYWSQDYRTILNYLFLPFVKK